MTSLYKHQAEVLELNPEKVLLAHSTGTGKTITAIELANKNADKTVLVVVPKMLKEKWARDTELHGKKYLRWDIVSKEEFKKVAKTLEVYDCVIIDEGHYFAGTKSQMFKAMAWYLRHHNIPLRYILTATPYLSTPLNIYALAYLLGHDWNYRTFVNKYFWQVQMGHRIVMKVKDNIEGEIAELVAQIGHIVDMEDIVEVPTQTHEIFNFELKPSQVQAKKEYAYTEATHIQQWTKEHQIENGFVYKDGDDMEVFFDDKTGKVMELGREHKKLAIFCRYRGQIERYKNMFEHRGRLVLELHGGIENRDEVINRANEADDCIILIQSACSAGYELPTFDTIIFASLDFSYVNYEQALGRFLRINKLKENRYIHLVSEGVDTSVYESIMNKRDFSFEIYGKSK